MYYANASVFKKAYKVGFPCLLQSLQCYTLTPKFGVVVLDNFLYSALKGGLANQKLWHPLVVPNLVQSHHAGSLPSGCPLHCLAPLRFAIFSSSLLWQYLSLLKRSKRAQAPRQKSALVSMPTQALCQKDQVHLMCRESGVFWFHYLKRWSLHQPYQSRSYQKLAFPKKHMQILRLLRSHRLVLCFHSFLCMHCFTYHLYS